jgi:site-specific DNA-cytosine methylase
LLGFGGGNCSGSIDVAASLAAHGVRQDFEVETFVAQPLLAKANSSHDDSKETYIATRGAESSGKGGYAGRRQEDDDNLVGYNITPSNSNKDFSAREAQYAQALTAQGGAPSARGGDVVVTPYTLAIRGRDGEPDLEYRQDGTANAILTPNGGRAGIGVGAVAIQAGAMRENPDSGPDGVGVQADIAYTLEARAEVQAVQERWAVRRLMPVECERLQGFPDGFTDIMPNGKPTADGPRYKALGNSMAVNVMRWIGQRIEMIDRLAAEELREAAE